MDLPTNRPGSRPSSAQSGRRDGAPITTTNSRRNVSRRPLPPSNNSSIRIRRLTVSRPDTNSDHESVGGRSSEESAVSGGRRRSSSAPQRMTHLAVPGAADATQSDHMPIIEERLPGSNDITPANEQISLDVPQLQPFTTQQPSRPTNLADLHNAGSSMYAVNGNGYAARAARGLGRTRSHTVQSRADTVRSRADTHSGDEYGDDVMGLLDLVDPEVQTLGTLTNVQNSLFVPDLGRLINRRPTYDLTSRPSTARVAGAAEATNRSRAGTLRSRAGTVSTKPPTISEDQKEDLGLERRASISSQLTDRHFAVLPHGERLEGWTDEDIAELNDHVRHALHSRRAGFKRSWRGFKKYISKPLGLFVFIYALLVTIGGATWVIFLIGWIYVGDRQSYATNVVDNILVALFALIGDGMAPFRAVDTYHMCFIAHYHHLTWRLRKQRRLPDLEDHNDLPARLSSVENGDPLAGESRDDLYDKEEFSVLSPLQQRRLQYHQAKFSKSHTFYRPHETATHHAFPLRLLVAVVVLLDCHSLFQVALGTCTWSIDYRIRPEALTATILSCSITCNIVAGILVSIGDKRTRKKEVLDRIFRQNLTAAAIEKIQKRHEEHDKHNYEDLAEGQTDKDAITHSEASQQPKDKGRISIDFARITNTAPRKSKEYSRAAKDMGLAERIDGPSTSSKVAKSD